MAETQYYAVPDLTLATTYTNPAMLPDMGVQQTQLDQLFSQNPVSMPVNDVIAAIQSQYQPVPVNYGEGPYGAARFIGQNSGVTDANQPVNIGTIPSWFTPGQFDINAFSSTPDQALANEIATGEFYGGSSPVEQVGTSEFANDPYANWGQSVPKGLSALVNMMIPGAGLALNAAQGYANTTLGNAINTGLSAYGGVPAGPSSTLAGALLGTIGVQTESGKMAQALGKQFSDQQSLYGYMSVATDPQMQSIAEALMANASTPLSANDVGVIGAAIGSQISSNIASGMSVGEAYAAAAQSLGGFTPGDAAALGASASQNAVQSAINSGSDINSLNPADVNAYNDPIGGLISNLGLSGSSTESSGNGGFSYGDTSDSGYSADTGYSGGGGWSDSDSSGGWGGY